MSIWKGMAHDAGYRDDEADQVARRLEEEEREKAERREAEQRQSDDRLTAEERIRHTRSRTEW